MLDVDDLKPMLRATIAAKPDNLNPLTVDGYCAYTDEYGCHCLIGQFAVDRFCEDHVNDHYLAVRYSQLGATLRRLLRGVG